MITCPLCKKKDTHGHYLTARDFLVSGETFAVTRCSNCKLLITNPKTWPGDIEKYYRSSEYVSHTDARRNLKEVLYALVKRVMMRRKLKWVSNHLYPTDYLEQKDCLEQKDHLEQKDCLGQKEHTEHAEPLEHPDPSGPGERPENPVCRQHSDTTAPALLDYGCGTGEFVLHASKNGYAAAGYEPDHNAREMADKKGVRVFSSWEDLETHGGSFDVITLWHVLEHIPNLQEVLQNLQDKLRKGGLMVIAVPMASSYDAQHYKEAWAAWDLPRHLYHFTPETLHRMLEVTDLQHVATYPMPFDAWYVALLSEQHKRRLAHLRQNRAGRTTPCQLLKAARTAIISNYRARKRKSPWSSQAFVWRKA